MKNMYVAQYLQGSYNNHVERRERKLLLNRKELRNLEADAKNPGFTIVPTRLYINENGLAKLDIALAKGKRNSTSVRLSWRSRTGAKWTGLGNFKAFIFYHTQES